MTTREEIAAAERERIKEISRHPHAKLYPKFVDMLCDSDADAHSCGKLLDAAFSDLQVALAAQKSEPAPKTSAEKQAELDAQKKDAGTLGIALPDSTERNDSSAGSAGWARAVAAANHQVE